MDELWDKTLKIIKEKVSDQNFETWIRPIRITALEGNQASMAVPNRFFRDWLVENYLDLLREAMKKAAGVAMEVDFTVQAESRHDAVKGQGGNAPAPAKSPAKKSARTAINSTLNPNYSFDRFVVGASNQFAHAASVAVADQPAKNYNPLFIYGGVGLGKTHLMQAVGSAIKKNWKEMRLAYVSSEKFTNEVINSLRYDRMVSFRDKYRSVDVLLMDDIQFIAGKERTQEEFFHTFNTLYEAQKQVVISSDILPKDIPGLEERLRSRFAWGLTADLQPPDLETKMAILAKKSEVQGVTLPENVAQFIATKIKSSIRDLEGALVRLIAYSSLTGTEVSLPMAQQVLKNLVDQQERRVTIENIQRVVCQEFSLSLPQLKAKDNSRGVAYPRQIAMYLAKEMTSASLPQIGREFGGKHHTTVLHSINKIDQLRKTDRDLNRLINKLSDSLN